jgi:hypothetical protein
VKIVGRTSRPKKKKPAPPGETPAPVNEGQPEHPQ